MSSKASGSSRKRQRKSETIMCQDGAKTVAEEKVARCCSSNTRNRSCFGRARIKPYDGQLSPPTHTYTFSDLYLFQPPTTPWACLQASFTFTSLLIIYCAHLSSNHSFAKPPRRRSRAFFTRIQVVALRLDLRGQSLLGLLSEGYAF